MSDGKQVAAIRPVLKLIRPGSDNASNFFNNLRSPSSNTSLTRSMMAERLLPAREPGVVTPELSGQIALLNRHLDKREMSK